tara:strand:+ start:792 stop:1295 length:504 start_codon:yes stop_codon:yes gene_type:complete
MTSHIDQEFINSILLSGFNTKLKDILQNICIDNPCLDYNNLIEKYCLSKLEIDDISINNKRKKRKKNKILDQHDLCMAKKADGLQCTRRKKDDHDYCGKHINNLKFGRIDDEIKYQDKEKYIRTRHEKLDGQDYLVDDDNIVYTFDKNNPMVVGTFIDGNIQLNNID